MTWKKKIPLEQRILFNIDPVAKAALVDDPLRPGKIAPFRGMVPRSHLFSHDPRQALMQIAFSKLEEWKRPSKQRPSSSHTIAPRDTLPSKAFTAPPYKSGQFAGDRQATTFPEDKPVTHDNRSFSTALELAKNAKDLKGLKEAIARFDGCSLKKFAKNLVFGEGNPQSALMFIGEAPGAEEDAQGRPFVGQSGQLLTKMILSLGLKREEVYITNIVNWRPPGNRQPSMEEIALFQPFVEKHVTLVQPKIIVLLGGTASKALLNRKESITRLRGTWHTYQPHYFPLEGRTIPLCVTFHPAYLLRSPGQKRESWRDFLRIKLALADLT